MQDTVGARNVETKTKVFISYSRKDMAFADRLEAALKARGFEVLIDRQEIYAFEDWWKRIEALIGGADTVVFVLSPDAVKSDVALKEVTHAASLNKRFAPIVCRRVEDSAVPEALRRLNFIFFDDPASSLRRALTSSPRRCRPISVGSDDIPSMAKRRAMGGGGTCQAGCCCARHCSIRQRRGSAFRPRAHQRRPRETKLHRGRAAKRIARSQRRRRIAQGSIFALMMAIILGLVGWINQRPLRINGATGPLRVRMRARRFGPTY